MNPLSNTSLSSTRSPREILDFANQSLNDKNYAVAFKGFQEIYHHKTYDRYAKINASFRMGVMYENNQGMASNSNNQQLAVQYFTFSADQSNIVHLRMKSSAKLAQKHFQGLGTKKDLDKAEIFAKQALDTIKLTAKIKTEMNELLKKIEAQRKKISSHAGNSNSQLSSSSSSSSSSFSPRGDEPMKITIKRKFLHVTSSSSSSPQAEQVDGREILNDIQNKHIPQRHHEIILNKALSVINAKDQNPEVVAELKFIISRYYINGLAKLTASEENRLEGIRLLKEAVSAQAPISAEAREKLIKLGELEDDKTPKRHKKEETKEKEENQEMLISSSSSSSSSSITTPQVEKLDGRKILDQIRKTHYPQRHTITVLHKALEVINAKDQNSEVVAELKFIISEYYLNGLAKLDASEENRLEGIRLLKEAASAQAPISSEAREKLIKLGELEDNKTPKRHKNMEVREKENDQRMFIPSSSSPPLTIPTTPVESVEEERLVLKGSPSDFFLDEENISKTILLIRRSALSEKLNDPDSAMKDLRKLEETTSSHALKVMSSIRSQKFKSNTNAVGSSSSSSSSSTSIPITTEDFLAQRARISEMMNEHEEARKDWNKIKESTQDPALKLMIGIHLQENYNDKEMQS